MFLKPQPNDWRDRWHGAGEMIHRIKPRRFFRVGACPAVMAKRHNRAVLVSPYKQKILGSHPWGWILNSKNVSKHPLREIFQSAVQPSNIYCKVL